MAVTLLEQRRIEAEIIAPILEAFGQRIGPELAKDVVLSVIRDLAFQRGRQLRAESPDGSLNSFAGIWEVFRQGGALDLDIVEQTDRRLHLKVKRCGYADLYRQLGVEQHGFTLSCARDLALVQGFSDSITLERKSTLMEGAACCEFIYQEDPA